MSKGCISKIIIVLIVIGMLFAISIAGAIGQNYSLYILLASPVLILIWVFIKASETHSREKHLDSLIQKMHEGDGESAYRAGVAFESGDGTPSDPEEAVKCYKIAYDLGHDNAAYEYALCLYHGKGIAQSKRRAIEIMQELALRGDEAAENRLAAWRKE